MGEHSCRAPLTVSQSKIKGNGKKQTPVEEHRPNSFWILKSHSVTCRSAANGRSISASCCCYRRRCRGLIIYRKSFTAGNAELLRSHRDSCENRILNSDSRNDLRTCSCSEDNLPLRPYWALFGSPQISSQCTHLSSKYGKLAIFYNILTVILHINDILTTF